MQHSVENLTQTKHSTLQQTPASRNEAFPISFTPKEYSFNEFLEFIAMVKPRYFRISTRKEKINIVFAISKKKAFFGRAETFSHAFQKLLSDIQVIA